MNLRNHGTNKLINFHKIREKLRIKNFLKIIKFLKERKTTNHSNYLLKLISHFLQVYIYNLLALGIFGSSYLGYLF